MRVTGQPLAVGALACAQLGVPVAAATLATQLNLLGPGEAPALIMGALVTIAVATVGRRDRGPAARRAGAAEPPDRPAAGQRQCRTEQPGQHPDQRSAAPLRTPARALPENHLSGDALDPRLALRPGRPAPVPRPAPPSPAAAAGRSSATGCGRAGWECRRSRRSARRWAPKSPSSRIAVIAPNAMTSFTAKRHNGDPAAGRQIGKRRSGSVVAAIPGEGAGDHGPRQQAMRSPARRRIRPSGRPR